MYGNIGSDTYYVNNVFDSVYEGVNSGENDQIISTVIDRGALAER